MNRILLACAVLVGIAPFGTVSSLTARDSRKTCSVQPLGKGQDDGPNILKAFSTCGNGGRIVLDSHYTVGTVLETTGLKNVDISLTGTIQYTPNITYWSPNSIYLTYQNATTFWFLGGDNIRLSGPGTIDGNGQIWWDTFANGGDKGTAGGSSRTFARPIPLTIGNASNVIVEDLSIVASPFWNLFLYQSKNVTYSRLNITAKSSSSAATANTDGIDIYRSDGVVIHDWIVNNSDDCVSFKPNSTNVEVYNMHCNGSHGISIGSLGQYAAETDIVANITVSDIQMLNAQNGARIKVFGGNPSPTSTAGGGSGYVKNVTFSNFAMTNVDHPVVINQCYFTAAATCAKYPSPLTISDIHYINVTGTSSGKDGGTVVSLLCSAECLDITAVGTRLSAPKEVAEYECKNVESLAQLDFNCTAPAS